MALSEKQKQIMHSIGEIIVRMVIEDPANEREVMGTLNRYMDLAHKINHNKKINNLLDDLNILPIDESSHGEEST